MFEGGKAEPLPLRFSDSPMIWWRPYGLVTAKQFSGVPKILNACISQN